MYLPNLSLQASVHRLIHLKYLLNCNLGAKRKGRNISGTLVCLPKMCSQYNRKEH